MPKKAATTMKKNSATPKRTVAGKKTSKPAVAQKKTAAAPKKTTAVKATAVGKKTAAGKKTSKIAGPVTPPNPYGVLKSSKPTIKEALRQDKARDARLSIQNNPDGLPWINNKVIKENLVGKRKTG